MNGPWETSAWLDFIVSVPRRWRLQGALVPHPHLVDGIRRVAVGETLLDPKVTTRVLEPLRHPPEDDELAGLTEQERPFDLIAEGLTNRQIGERMYLAEKTVKNYVSNVLAKLGMSRRAEAAAYAARLAERRRRRVAPSKRGPTSALWAPRRKRPAGHSLTRSQRVSAVGGL